MPRPPVCREAIASEQAGRKQLLEVEKALEVRLSELATAQELTSQELAAVQQRLKEVQVGSESTRLLYTSIVARRLRRGIWGVFVIFWQHSLVGTRTPGWVGLPVIRARQGMC